MVDPGAGLGVSFGWPLALLLLPLPLLWLAHGTSSADNGLTPPPLITEALADAAGSSRHRANWLAALLWLAWVLVVGATAQPSVIGGEAIKPASGRAIELVIDLSSSMERRDFELAGEPVDRLTALKTVARDFIARRQGDRMGLMLFGDEAFSAAPISYDLAAISNALEESATGMAGRATAIGDALGLAIVKLRADPAAEKTIVLLSDGTNNSGQAEPEDAAKLATQFGIHIQTIGMASEKGADGMGMDPAADLDETTLKRIAEIGGGQFFRARTTDELKDVYAAIDRIETSENAAPPTVPRLDVRNWLLWPAAAALAAASVMLMRRRAA